jgi:hypothetical protein
MWRCSFVIPSELHAEASTITNHAGTHKRGPIQDPRFTRKQRRHGQAKAGKAGLWVQTVKCEAEELRRSSVHSALELRCSFISPPVDYSGIDLFHSSISLDASASGCSLCRLPLLLFLLLLNAVHQTVPRLQCRQPPSPLLPAATKRAQERDRRRWHGSNSWISRWTSKR